MSNTYQQIFKKLFILPTILICTTVLAIEPFQATYQVDYNDKPLGTAISLLKNTKTEWDYSFTATAGNFINASAQSIFQIQSDAIQSSSFNRKSQFLFFKSENNVLFNTEKMIISTQDNKNSYIYPLEPNIYDELNVELQIREDLKHKQLKNEYLVAGTKEIRSVRLTQNGTEDVTTNAGTYETLKITMTHDEKGRETTFWLAPSLDYIPVKALHLDRNFSYSISLNEYKTIKSD